MVGRIHAFVEGGPRAAQKHHFAVRKGRIVLKRRDTKGHAHELWFQSVYQQVMLVAMDMLSYDSRERWLRDRNHPLWVKLVFILPPLKTKSQPEPTGVPDWDNLAEGVLNSLKTAKLRVKKAFWADRLFYDDGQIVGGIVVKRYPEKCEPTGMRFWITDSKAEAAKWTMYAD